MPTQLNGKLVPVYILYIRSWLYISCSINEIYIEIYCQILQGEGYYATMREFQYFQVIYLLSTVRMSIKFIKGLALSLCLPNFLP